MSDLADIAELWATEICDRDLDIVRIVGIRVSRSRITDGAYTCKVEALDDCEL